MEDDADIKQLVEAELRWDPEFDESEIAVTVRGGVVTLSGIARSYAEKFAAQNAAKRVKGVSGVANAITVRHAAGHATTDAEIAQDAVAQLQSEAPTFSDKVKVLVREGVVTLEGAVEWRYQREAAESAVRRLKDIHGINNLIVVHPTIEPTDIQRGIESAFQRNASLEAKQVWVETRGNEVILKGHVHSWLEREAAEDAAWAAPGVKQVKNEISVGF
jgi:osmotically-inducible protein OsmY